jgi:hypothetical protein
MGLDMYLISEDSITGDVEQIGYWRNHPNLHGWMENFWIKNCNPSETTIKASFGLDTFIMSCFNGVPVYLDMTMLSQLQNAIFNDELPHTEGPFFGESSNTENQINIDLDLIAKAAIELAIGKKVFYTSSW